MKERIQVILEEKNLSAVRFAEILEVQPSSISHLISGRNNPSFEFVAKVLTKFPEINPDWFILGKGEIFRGATTTISPEKRIPLSLFEDAPRKTAAEIPLLSPGETKNDRKKLEKIILLYSDQTFSVYDD